MYSRACLIAASETRTESVRMYVIRPTEPRSPNSTPSYSFWAARIVRPAENPSCLAASCCIVLVVKGAGALRRRSPRSTAVTTNGSFATSASIDVERVGERLRHGVLGDLVEQDAADAAILAVQLGGDVPRDRFAFAVGVGGDQDAVR